MPQKKLKIAIFHLGFVYSGGGERLVLEEAIGLGELGHDVTVFAPVIDEKNCFPDLMRKVRVRKILPNILSSWIPDYELFSILAACLLVPFFFYKFRDFDIYFGANQPGPWIAYLLSKINRKRYIIYLAQPTRLIHPRLIDQQVGLRLRDGFSLLNVVKVILRPFISYADVRSIKGAKKVFVNGSYMAGLLREVYGVRAVNCPGGAVIRIKNSSFAKASEGKRELRIKNDIDFRLGGSVVLNGKRIKKPFVLVTNRHFPHKKFEYAIEAVEKLKRNISLVIAGQLTGYTDKLRKKYKGLRFVKFVGLLSEKELEMAYRNAAVYVYPAPEEDFGMGIVEAMANGLPVVAWGNAGPTGIVEHEEDGLLAKPFGVTDFSRQIRKVLDNEDLYLKISRNAELKARRLFSMDKHVSLLNRYFVRSVSAAENRNYERFASKGAEAEERVGLPRLGFEEAYEG
jgi:glycosyltransferase involved in cell wall biosynthesis